MARGCGAAAQADQCVGLPARIAGEIGIDATQLQAAAQEPGTDQHGRTTRTGDVFRIAGEALGRGISAMLNIANPGNLLLLLPPELAKPAHGSAAIQYIQAVENALDKECFSTAAGDARAGRSALQVETMHPNDILEARSARASVLDSFIAHARGDGAESLAKIRETG